MDATGYRSIFGDRCLTMLRVIHFAVNFTFRSKMNRELFFGRALISAGVCGLVSLLLLNEFPYFRFFHVTPPCRIF